MLLSNYTPLIHAHVRQSEVVLYERNFYLRLRECRPYEVVTSTLEERDEERAGGPSGTTIENRSGRLLPRPSEEEGNERRRKERTEPLRVDTLALNSLVILTECSCTEASTSAPRLVPKTLWLVSTNNKVQFKREECRSTGRKSRSMDTCTSK